MGVDSPSPPLLVLVVVLLLLVGSSSSSASPCGPDAVTKYVEDGFVVCPGLFSGSELEALRGEIVGIARGDRGAVHGVVQQPEKKNDTAAASDENDDAALLSRFLAFHHPHKLSPVLKAALKHDGLVQVLSDLIGSPNVKCMQSMYFFKGPGKPGQAWHQDEQYIPTRDRSLVGAFIAIEDTDVENGCLWMHAGSQRTGVLYRMAAHNDSRFDPSGEATGFPYDAEGGTPCEAKSGTVVFFNGYVLHRSLPNRSPTRSRQAFVGHFMSAESWLPWDADGTITPAPKDNRDVFMVSGTDPYAYRGYDEGLTKPFVRPDKRASGDSGLDDRGAAAAAMSSSKGGGEL